MLSCNINIECVPDYLFDCASCDKCEPISTLNYPFSKDLKDSNELVIELKKYIEQNTKLKCFDTEENKNPDIKVVDIFSEDFLLCRIEAKYLEGKAFVKSSQTIGLRPKETLVVDEPKLIHYFKCKELDFKNTNRRIPLFVVWKFDRPCNDIGGITVFQEIDVLKEIYNNNQNRLYERKCATNDFVDGVKQGVTKKFHFSIKETRPFWQLLQEIFDIAKQNNLFQIPININSPTDTTNKLPLCETCNAKFEPRIPSAKLCINCWKKSNGIL